MQQLLALDRQSSSRDLMAGLIVPVEKVSLLRIHPHSHPYRQPARNELLPQDSFTQDPWTVIILLPYRHINDTARGRWLVWAAGKKGLEKSPT